jgi:hypothetical protein
MDVTNSYRALLIGLVAPYVADFVTDGVLPPRDFELTLAELRTSILVLGPHTGGRDTWDESWRRKLVDNLEILVKQLHRTGISEVFINGSFVEDKDHPNDIDGYFVCDLRRLASGELQRELYPTGGKSQGFATASATNSTSPPRSAFRAGAIHPKGSSR